MTASKQAAAHPVGLWGAVAIGIGGMVGGGIFAVLGLSVQITKGAAPLAFLLAGLVALLTARSYALLSKVYPSRGGTITFLNRTFGGGLFSGGINVLLWLSYIVMLALYSQAFGSYAASFLPQSAHNFGKHVFLTAAIVVITVVNIAGGMIIFLAYEGFELIANSAEDVANPAQVLTRAYYISVLFVIALYIAVAIVSVGSLPLSQLINARDYALAEAARPALGGFGFAMIGVAAMLSTASAINATLYGSARMTYTIAKSRELPAPLDRPIWDQPLEGLLITATATVLLANVLDLASISTMGSAGFLIIFAAVNLAAAHTARTWGSSPWISVAAAVACVGALAALIAMSSLRSVSVLVAMVALSFGIESTFRKVTGRPIHA